MNHLQGTSRGLSEVRRHARLPERLAVERAAARLGGVSSGKRDDPEPWSALIKRVDVSRPVTVRPKDLRRLLFGVWDDASLDADAPAILDEGVRRDRKSIDRAIIHSYLDRFPLDHPALSRLTAACALVANRRDWPWRERGVAWELWNAEVGPENLARALLATDDPAAPLRSAGLDGDRSRGGFVEASLIDACFECGRHAGREAEQNGGRLVDLVNSVGAPASLNSPLAYALLRPWITNAPSAAHQRRISNLLVARNDDPRLNSVGWAALRADLLELEPGAEVDEAFATLRRWLVQSTVREFFAIVLKATDRRDQWQARTDFWLGYLDAGVISDAWFAFGAVAGRLAKPISEDDGLRPARLEGAGATANQSALIFTIADLRISEWSDNGSARFWKIGDPRAPEMYKTSYSGQSLRAMTGGTGFRAVPHQPSSGWQPKFARFIYVATGIRHPRHGAGW